jgi:hypothetical protein
VAVETVPEAFGSVLAFNGANLPQLVLVQVSRSRAPDLVSE